MEPTDAKKQINTILFTNLLMLLSSTAMQQLGKLVNPMTSKTEVNLDGAQVTIDMIEMLKDKTTGNLEKDESKMLNDILSSLQMNFVETASSAGSRPEADKEQPEQKAGKNQPAAENEGKTAAKNPKFHKAYGEEKEKPGK